MPRILYLVHDLADSAVSKRIRMLRDGGAEVTVAGFRRTAEAPAEIAGAPAIDLGQTFNGGFAQRIAAVLKVILGIKRYRPLFDAADIVIARNLEMLAIGVRGRKPASTLVYESLDIHRLLLRPDLVGRSLRALEGWLTRRASALITSSPAFIENYFKPMSSVRLPVRLVENKVYNGEETAPLFALPRPDGPPWRIGWFGAIRCAKSLKALAKAAQQMDGRIEVIIRGKPAYDQLPSFEQIVTQTPHLRFEGAYKNPDDLEKIYGDVHFTWAIDQFEAGQNSSWLLPNRIYEGGRYGAVPIALAGVETAALLSSLGTGLTLARLSPDSINSLVQTLTTFEYRTLFEKAMSVPAARWTCTRQDCVELVSYLSNLKGSGSC